MDPRSKMAPGSSGGEIDPIVLKALKLLHSRNPDSLDQLRALRDEVFKQQHHGAAITPKEGKPMVRADKKPGIHTSSTIEQKKYKRKEAKIVIQTTMGSGKAETLHRIPSRTEGIGVMEQLDAGLDETVEEICSSSLMEVSAKRAKLQISVDNAFDEEVLKSHETLPVEDLTIDLGGSVCVVCAREESKIPGNRLVECNECHSHYHQRCHETRVSDQDANDPRHVWYCAQCTKKMKEMTTSPTLKARSAENAGPSKHRLPPLQPFRKSSISEGKAFPSPSTQQSFVIPALSANSTASTSSKTSSTAGSSQNIAMQTAMRRLQMVKKKAQQKILNHQQIRIPRR